MFEMRVCERRQELLQSNQSFKLLWIRHTQKLTIATARDLNADVGFDEVARTRLVEEVQRDADE